MSPKLKNLISDRINNLDNHLDPRVSTYFYALSSKNIGVEIFNGSDFCIFNKIASGECELTECCVNTQEYNGIIKITNLELFIELISEVQRLLDNYKQTYSWLRYASILSIWNNATEYDFNHPEEYLQRWIHMINNITPDIPLERLGQISFSESGIRNIFIKIEGSPSEQEAPQEFVTYLADENGPLPINELHRVRFGISSPSEATITSVQMGQIELTIKELEFRMEKLFCEISTLLKLCYDCKSFVPFIKQLPIDLIKEEFEGLYTGIDDGSRQQKIIDKAEEIRLVLNIIHEGLSQKFHVLQSLLPPNKRDLLAKLKAELNFCTINIYPELERLIKINSLYAKRMESQRVLNKPMRLKKGGTAAQAVGNAFSLVNAMLFLRKIGVTQVRMPFVFPIRELKHNLERTEYIINQKSNLISRIKIELGLSDNQIVLLEDGCTVYIDISSINIIRPLLLQLESLYQDAAATES